MSYSEHEIKQMLIESNSEFSKNLKELDKTLERRLDKQDDQITRLSDELIEIQQKGVTADRSIATGGANSLSNVLTKSDGLASFKGGAKNSGQIDLGMSVKTLTSLQGNTGSPAVGIDVQDARIPGLYGYAARPLTLMEVLNSRPIASNQATFTRMSNFTSGADYQTGEAAEKSEQSIDPELITAPVATIASWQDVSRQVMEDEIGLQNSLLMLMQHTVMAKAEAEIVAGSGGSFEISGLETEATVYVPTAGKKADRLGELAAEMQGNGYQPNLILLNPADWFEIRSERATDDVYVSAGWAAPTPPTCYDIPVVTSPSVTAGTGLVLDTRWIEVLDRQQPTVEFSRESGSNFKQNLITVLAELRIGLAVYNTGACRYVDLDATG